MSYSLPTHVLIASYAPYDDCGFMCVPSVSILLAIHTYIHVIGSLYDGLRLMVKM